MESREPPKLDRLSDAYEIIGEISGRTDARAFMAKRTADNIEVLVTVATQPDGDEGNALSHLAADTNLLKSRRHRTLLPVIDGLWVDDALVIVSERPEGSALEELLARREEEFEYPRIAMVLQDVNALLEWARDQKVVHRALGTESVYLEPGSDRVSATFELRALPIADMPGPDEDGRTIALLARAMLTRSAAAPERASQPLAELRPGLPASVVEQTEALLTRSDTDRPDVKSYIASIAMAEALKRGETECANTMAQLREEERAAREKIEAEMNACVLAAQEQQQEFEQERAEIAKERERERVASLKEREKERAALKREREAILAELAKERQSLLKVRDALERERSEVLRKAAELETQRELYANTQQYQTPVGDATLPIVPALPEIPELKRDAPRRWLVADRARAILKPSWVPRGGRGRPLIFAGGAAALLLLIALAAVVDRPKAATLARAGTPTLVDSAGGVTVTRAGSAVEAAVDSSETLGTLGIPADFLSGVASRAALAPPAVRRPRRRPVDSSQTRSDSAAAFDSLTRPDTGLAGRVPIIPTLPNVDSLGRPRVDTLFRRDSARRDSLLPRRDTLRRRDTLPRDTLPRDTLRPNRTNRTNPTN